jgi:dTDP-4-dehydrorhamnose reductase
MENNIQDIFNYSLITGGNGMIGKYINFGYKPSSKEMDITNCVSIDKYINSISKITCIIHLACLNLRDSEKNVSKSIDININGTINILNIARKYNIPFILLSSGAVFSSSDKDITFDENSVTCPNCVYGYTKASSEKIACMYNKSIVIRTGWLFGGTQKNNCNFVEKFINNLVNNDKIMASVDFYGSPTYIVDLIEKIKYLLLNSLYGVYNIVNDEKATSYEVANEISSILNKSTNLIEPVKKENVPNVGPDRSNSEALKTLYDFNKMRSWKCALREYVSEYIKNKEATLYTNIDNTKIVMSNIWCNREKCRLCNSKKLFIFYKLNPTPLANHFLKEQIKQDIIPLDISICEDCKHIQLIQIVNPSYQYSNYIYISSVTKIMINHLTNNVNKFIKNNNISKTSNILEIGSNDGTCIKYLLENGFKNVIGIDPAINIHKQHNLPIICDYFGFDTKNKIKQYYDSYKLIFAFHCCAHIENIQDVFKTIYDLLDNDGIFVMEVGYFYEVFKNKLFDTIYHEHIDYHTCTAIQKFANSNNLLLYDANCNDIQGGSIQFFFTKNKSSVVSNNVYNCLKKENELEMFNITNLNNWKNNINLCKIDINYFLKYLKSLGKKIAGYGASAKSTTFLYEYNLNKDFLEFIIDDSVYKQNMFTPGLHIAIKDINILDSEKIDYIIILSWNFTDIIVEKLKKYRINNNIRIIIPFPEIKII